jgi:hypothetical protein
MLVFFDDPEDGSKAGPHQRNPVSSRPTLIQLKGLIEFIREWISRFSGAGLSVNCDLPGNKKPGYCKEKE